MSTPLPLELGTIEIAPTPRTAPDSKILATMSVMDGVDHAVVFADRDQAITLIHMLASAVGLRVEVEVL